MIPMFTCGSRRSKGVRSGSGVFLWLLVRELWTSQLAKIFAYGKWLYPYRMLLHSALDLDWRCLKTRRSAVVAFLGGFHQISLSLPPKLPPKPHFGGPFNAKPITDRALRKWHDNGATKLKLYGYIGIGKYSSVCQNFSTRGRRAPYYTFGNPLISRKLLQLESWI